MRAWHQEHRGALIGIAVAALATAGVIVAARGARAPEDAAAAAAVRHEEAPEGLTPRVLSALTPAPAALAPGEAHVGTDEPAPAGDTSSSVDAVAALRLGLLNEDVATRIAAVEAAVSATAVETLGELSKFDLKRDPEAAPTVIHGLALLGASADGQKRDEAAKTLSKWLREEMKREGPDVPGNISNLVEAVGNVGGADAVAALTAALDGQELPLHVETLAVMKLGELGDAAARGAVERFAGRVAELPKGEDELDEELRVEAIQAARDTLTKI